MVRPLAGSAMICKVGRWLPDTCTRTRSKPMASIAGVINLAIRSANMHSVRASINPSQIPVPVPGGIAAIKKAGRWPTLFYGSIPSNLGIGAGI